jgi:hypothetical protein
VPVGIVNESNLDALDGVRSDRRAYAVCLETEHNTERRKPGGGCGVEGAKDQGASGNWVKELGVVVFVLEPVAVAGGEDDGIPGGTR